jgi:Multicopper oxidase
MTADNPGTWLFHCQVADHMESGMMASFTIYEPPSTKCPLEFTSGTLWIHWAICLLVCLTLLLAAAVTRSYGHSQVLAVALCGITITTSKRPTIQHSSKSSEFT